MIFRSSASILRRQRLMTSKIRSRGLIVVVADETRRDLALCLQHLNTGFAVQFGLASNPIQTEKWKAEIPDDPVVQSNLYGYVSFAQTGEPNSCGSQIFINIHDNPNLDMSGYTPFARVISGMDVVEIISAMAWIRPRLVV